MLFRFAVRGSFIAGVLVMALCVGPGAVDAQVAPDPGDGADADDGSTDPTAAAGPAAPLVRYGAAVRLRNVRIPEGMFEWFIEDVPGGVSNFGFGAELLRRKGDFEVSLGLEYEKLSVTPGLWVEKGKPIMGGSVDRVEDDGFGWVTAELTFMYHTPILPQLAVRYGGGAGIGVLLGDVRRTDQLCASNSLDSCIDAPAPNDDEPYDLPPVMLVVNAILGLQIRPTNEIFINVEGGLRTVPFFGVSGGYYF
jgi:hypothetical protein